MTWKTSSLKHQLTLQFTATLPNIQNRITSFKPTFTDLYLAFDGVLILPSDDAILLILFSQTHSVVVSLTLTGLWFKGKDLLECSDVVSVTSSLMRDIKSIFSWFLYVNTLHCYNHYSFRLSGTSSGQQKYVFQFRYRDDTFSKFITSTKVEFH